MTQNTSTSHGKHPENLIESKISEESYKNASEIICAGLSLLEEENKALALRKAIQDGITSGIAINFNPEHHLNIIKTMKER